MIPSRKDEKIRKILSLDTRRRLYEKINRFPGLHFREIQRRSELAIGSLRYHLDFLERNKIITSRREGDILRFYPSGLTAEERRLLGLLRQKHIREIVIFLLKQPKASHKDIVNEVDLAPSTVSWYLKKLESSKAIEIESGGPFHYKILRKSEIIKVLIIYKESFLDKLVDGFVTMWEDGYFRKQTEVTP